MNLGLQKSGVGAREPSNVQRTGKRKDSVEQEDTGYGARSPGEVVAGRREVTCAQLLRDQVGWWGRALPGGCR